LVVVIDNLDRCDDKVAVELLGIIQTFMAKENCINILACDDEAIVNHLHRVKGEGYTEREGNEFLSKFFQVTIRIPPFIGENLDSYAQELISQRSVDFHPFVKQILISGAIENPRKINQFLNNAVALFRLAEWKENDDKLPKGVITEHTEVLTKMIVLRHEWPTFYKALEENPKLLNDSGSFKEWVSNIPEKDINQIKGLEKFLNTTRFAFVDDIIPFLRLNQETYASESSMDEFEISVNTNDLETVIEIFDKLDENKKPKYIKKIEALSEKHQNAGDSLSLMNTTFVLIGLLEEIDNASQRIIALAILGRYLSSTLLEHLEKYDLEKLIVIIDEMVLIFSRPIYSALISLITKEEGKINTKIVKLFMENETKISAHVMKKIDSTLADLFEKNEDQILEITKEICVSPTWSSNNISKPSKLISTIISAITLKPEDGLDLPRLEVYQSIQDTLHPSEKQSFVEHLAAIVDEAVTNSTALPPKFFEVVENVKLLEYENMVEGFIVLFESLIESTDKNPDAEQKKTIFELLFRILDKIKEE